jgi:cytochrome P450
MRQVLGTVTGYGLLTVTGNEHKQMRKAMNPAFSLANLMARRLRIAFLNFLSDSSHRDRYVL